MFALSRNALPDHKFRAGDTNMKHSISDAFDDVHAFNASPLENNRNSSIPYAAEHVIAFIEENPNDICHEIVNIVLDDDGMN
jgi:hypothetical protein